MSASPTPPSASCAFGASSPHASRLEPHAVEAIARRVVEFLTGTDELSRRLLSADARLMARAMADALRKEGSDR